jgi:hypothetical protein
MERRAPPPESAAALPCSANVNPALTFGRDNAAARGGFF